MPKLSCILVILFSLSLSAEELVVRHKPALSEQDQRNNYYLALLELALDKTEASVGPYRLEQSTVKMQQNRSVISLDQGKFIDVIWTMTSQDCEQRLLPIRIPLLKGLLGHRIFIIDEQQQARFAAVSSLEELRSLRAGQGAHWPDTAILKANQLRVITGNNYDGLFGMLHQQRFDYFPRGVNEPWQEVIAKPQLNLMVEPHLMLKYPAPTFFFVNPNNLLLKDRIERGLLLAIEDGSFDQLFYGHSSTQQIFQKAKLEQRLAFELDNPYLSEETRATLADLHLWYQPGDELRWAETQ